eukprot:GHVO01034936.1.p1 GENE.GHVO01034936.1~~GHVO01034936.1.p1  ORF type:complete len:177 (-),score=8.89 GHVO01034936.1:138-668(-)
MQSSRRRMSIDRRATDENAVSIRRQNRPRSRRNGMANILTGLTPNDINALHSSRHSRQALNTNDQCRVAPLVPVDVDESIVADSSSSGYGSVASETSSSAGSRLSPTPSECSRVSVSPMRRALDEVLRADTDTDWGNRCMTPPSPQYFRKRRNAVSYVNASEYFLQTVMNRAQGAL